MITTFIATISAEISNVHPATELGSPMGNLRQLRQLYKLSLRESECKFDFLLMSEVIGIKNS